jgi:predicted transcriptional regulator
MIDQDDSVRLSPSEKEVLLYILKNGQTYAYYLSHKAKILNTEKTASEALNHLLTKDLLEKKDAGQERKRKEYYLTLKGLCTALLYSAESEDVWHKIEGIIDRWGYLLPLFKKFSLFKKHGLEKYFKETLIHEARLYVLFHGRWLRGNAINIENDFIERSMHRADADFMMKWNRVLHEDAGLRRRAKWLLESHKKMTETHLQEYAERISRVFPKLETPNPDWDELRKIEDSLSGAHIDDSGLVLVNGNEVRYKSSNESTAL